MNSIMSQKYRHQRIGFLVDKYTFRGTTIATWDYAFYNEKLLHNFSIIISPKTKSSEDIINVFRRFDVTFKIMFYDKWNEVEELCRKYEIDAVYIIKYGKKDEFVLSNIPTFIHCVFTTEEPHGTVYCGVSDSVAEKNNFIYSLDEKQNFGNENTRDFLLTSVPKSGPLPKDANKDQKFNNTMYIQKRVKFPVVNHIVQLPEIEKGNKDYRNLLEIPKEAVVFGRHGGADTFDIPFVKNVILKFLCENKNIYFIFAGERPNILKNIEHSHIIYIEPFSDLKIKRKFINTCDAMLDACSLGQSFGLSILEFSFCNKPVITWNGGTLHNQHLRNLGNKGLLYNNENDLVELLTNFIENKDEILKKDWKIDIFTPEYVMNQFKSVFLDSLVSYSMI